MAEGTGILPNAAAPCGALLNYLCGPISLLFLGFTMLPLVFALGVELGVKEALLIPLMQIASLSPLYFTIQSRCIGHFFGAQMSAGGSSYVPTGRGLAITRLNFHALYGAFAVPVFNPGAELAAFLVLSPLANPNLTYESWGIFFAILTPLALLLGPAFFNPDNFEMWKATQVRARTAHNAYHPAPHQPRLPPCVSGRTSARGCVGCHLCRAPMPAPKAAGSLSTRRRASRPKAAFASTRCCFRARKR